MNFTFLKFFPEFLKNEHNVTNFKCVLVTMFHMVLKNFPCDSTKIFTFIAFILTKKTPVFSLTAINKLKN